MEEKNLGISMNNPTDPALLEVVCEIQDIVTHLRLHINFLDGKISAMAGQLQTITEQLKEMLKYVELDNH